MSGPPAPPKRHGTRKKRPINREILGWCPRLPLVTAEIRHVLILVPRTCARHSGEDSTALSRTFHYLIALSGITENPVGSRIGYKHGETNHSCPTGTACRSGAADGTPPARIQDRHRQEYAKVGIWLSFPGSVRPFGACPERHGLPSDRLRPGVPGIQGDDPALQVEFSEPGPYRRDLVGAVRDFGQSPRNAGAVLEGRDPEARAPIWSPRRG